MFKKESEAKVGDPLEDLLDLALEAKAKLRRIDMVVAFGNLAGLMTGGLLLLVGAMGLYLRGIDAVFLMAIAGGVVCLSVGIISEGLEQFFSHFRRRLETIERFVTYEPRPSIPSGASPLDRVLTWLRTTDTRFQEIEKGLPRLLKRNLSPPGMDSNYTVDAHFVRKSRLSSREFHLFVKVFEGGISEDDLEGLKRQTENVLRKVKVAPSRIIALQTVSEDISDEVASWVDQNWILYPVGKAPGKEMHACPIEVLVESSDGHYDQAIIYVG